MCTKVRYCDLKYEIFTYETQYHGGTNFGRYAGGPFITTSYDYDAPLDEYGNLFNIFEAEKGSNFRIWTTF